MRTTLVFGVVLALAAGCNRAEQGSQSGSRDSGMSRGGGTSMGSSGNSSGSTSGGGASHSQDRTNAVEGTGGLGGDRPGKL